MNKFFDKANTSFSIKTPKKRVDKEKVKEHLISEKELKKTLKEKRNVLLVEPNYKRKYIPMGLAKISSFVKSNNGRVAFRRESFPNEAFDCICVTSVFTYDSAIVLETINHLKRKYKNIPIIVGGIYASLMPQHILQNTSKNILIFKGCASFLDHAPIDYTVDWQVEEQWNSFSVCFTTRGCPNKCAYCAVQKLEPVPQIVKNWKDHICDDKPNVMLFDNNLSTHSMEHVREVLHFLQKKNKRVVFDNGFDCKHINKELAEELAKIKYTKTGMRLAFDRIEEDGVFQSAVKTLIDAGVTKSSIMAYILFNFTDSPKEADYRARECVRLGVHPYPQKYIPLNSTDRKTNQFIGKYWTPTLVSAFRNFWLMGGLFRKMTFEEYINSTKDYNLTERDIDFYENSKKKGEFNANSQKSNTSKRS